MNNVAKKTNRKIDRKRIALGQKHERDYLKKIAKEQLEKLKKQEGQRVWGNTDVIKFKEKCSKVSLIRICRALLKALK